MTMGPRKNHKVATLLIADDHPILRNGVRGLLESETDMQVIGEAADGVDVLKKARALIPDLVILDISMPNMNIAKTIGAICRECPSTKVLILTMHESFGYVKSTIEAGASGYVCKRVADTELVPAIRAIQGGRMYVNLPVGESFWNTIRNQFNPELQERLTNSEFPLSHREEEVVLGVAQGFTNQEIAVKLNISIKSVETYRHRVMEKLNLHSRAELVRYVNANNSTKNF